MDKHSILLVDDDKFLLEMYRKKFAEKVSEITLAVGAEEALAKLREGLKPDIMILDIIMPVMDGLELLETIRKENLAPKAKVIMLTNESSSDKIEKAKSFGIQGYIIKATSIPSEIVDQALQMVN